MKKLPIIKKTLLGGTVLVMAVMSVAGCRRHSEWENTLKLIAQNELLEMPQEQPDESADGTAEPDQATVESQPVTTEPGPAVDIPKKTQDGKPVIKEGPRHNDRIRIGRIGRLAEVFNDSNHVQLMYARQLGIEPIHSLADAYATRRPMVHVRSTKHYTVDSLKHSLPFLVPEAERLLDKIGRNFIDSLASRGADGYRILVTSLLRTPRTVKRLRRVNVNATDSSTHQFGTTFDLSYVRFHCLDSTRTINSEDLKNLLGEVLVDLRAQGDCLVKYERKTGCYHITAIR